MDLFEVFAYWDSKENQSQLTLTLTLQFCQFLVCCFSIHGAPHSQPFVKVGGTFLPLMPYGVGATEHDYDTVTEIRL